MICRFLIFFASAVLPQISSAQERIEVIDPEIKFSYSLPDGWEIKDDGYDYLILPRSIENTAISMTYLEGAQGSGNMESLGAKQSFEEDFLFEIRYILPEEFSNLKVQENGNTTIDETSARWVKFQHGDNGDKVGIFYMYQKHNQTFKIIGTAPSEHFEKMKPFFNSIVQSLKSSKI